MQEGSERSQHDCLRAPLLKKAYTVDYLTKKTKVNEGEIPQYYVEGDHEAIIYPAVFDRVQIELERHCCRKLRKTDIRRHNEILKQFPLPRIVG